MGSFFFSHKLNKYMNEVLHKDWYSKLKRPIVIAGPCSAETEEQVIETLTRVKRTGKVDMFRAGIWKPRTRPNSFEGVGAKGLPWLQRAKEELEMPISVEVAKASHVELCLEFGIDLLWIGARTTVNPFAVQEIANALKGVDIPVYIKNPINPDLALWIGAVERIQKAGIKDIGAIHRGFSFFGEKFFRNRPLWQIPLEFSRKLPDIPMICDPSHICGRRDILQEVGQKAMDLNFDGLMIESHIDPDNAWSDASQQITPEVLGEMITDMTLREYDIAIESENALEGFRGDIDRLDDELLNILSNRMKIAGDIGHYKKANNITIFQNERWDKIIKRFREKGLHRDLSEEFILGLIKVIHDESINHQTNV